LRFVWPIIFATSSEQGRVRNDGVVAGRWE
jgi:hypothetical protein